MRLRTLSTILSDVLSHLPGAEYKRAKCEALAAQVQEQRSHIEDLARRLEYTTRQKDEAEEREAEVAKDAEARLNAVWHHIGEKKTLTDERDAAQKDSARVRLRLYEQADAILAANSDLAAVKEERDAEKASHENTVRDRNARIAERNEARAQYEAEKVAHGDAQRHLAAAIAERDEWQLSHGTVAREKEQLRVELHTLRARVAELHSGEPVAWEVVQQPAVLGGMTRSKSLADTWASNGSDVRPLYAAQQPAAPAFGVEGELFVCWKGACMWLTDDDDDEGARDTGTRAEVEARAKKIAGSKVMRLVDADAPVVDVAKIRAALNTLRGIRIWTAGDLQVGADAFATIAAAIGEKA